jgi:hypothetical protein
LQQAAISCTGHHHHQVLLRKNPAKRLKEKILTAQLPKKYVRTSTTIKGEK